MTGPELSRPVRIDTLSAEPRTVTVEAEPPERELLARRFGLAEIGSLAAEAALARRGREIVARGRLRAEVVQSCVATGEPVPQTLDAPFDLVFRPHPDETKADEEIELSEAELDVIFYDGGSVDLGEAVAETLLLNLEPYPRAPGADSALREAGVRTEEQARAQSSPFAGLKGVK